MLFITIILFVFTAIRPCHFQCGCRHDELKRSVSLESIEKYKAAWEAADKDNKPLWEGDMRIHPQLLDYYYNDNKTAHSRSTVADRFRWANNELPYYIDDSIGHDNKVLVNLSLGWMQEKLKDCVKFTFYKDEPTKLNNYVLVSGVLKECSSHIGVQGGKQTISLGRDSCFHPGGVQHEFMHALGFIHEHNRPDRDNHVHVHGQNILSTACHNFRKCTACQTFGLNYDYGSVMHYPDNGFACREGLITLSSTDEIQDIYYQRMELSEMDALKIRAYYDCDKREE